MKVMDIIVRTYEAICICWCLYQAYKHRKALKELLIFLLTGKGFE